MKTETREKTTKSNYNVYIAFDGTEFCNEEECHEYENSAKGVLRYKVQPLIVNQEYNAWELLGGDSEHQIIVFKVPTQADADTLKHFLNLECPWMSDMTTKFTFAAIDSTVGTDDLLLFGKNCDGDYYYINTRNTIINNLRSLDKPKEDK